MTQRYDALIIGGGHNGLVAAAYLARAGQKVLVLERRPVLGGASVTEEIVPGFKFSRLAYLNSLFRPEIIRDLDLHAHGLEFLPRNPSSFSPFPDGRYLLLGPDHSFNQREISKFSPKDAEAYPKYEAWLETFAEFIESTLDLTPPDLTRLTPGNLLTLAGLGRRALGLGPRNLQALVELLTGAATPILDRWFESEHLKVTLATDAVIGAMASPSMPGTAYVLLHHVMGTTGGARGVWAYVRGGMGALSEALASAARAAGAEIRTKAAVAQILSERGRAVGVVLANGDEIRARVVLSNADPVVTFLKLIPEGVLPDDFRAGIAALDFSSATIKINVALSELPNFVAAPGREAGPQHRGTIHISPTMDYVERAFDDAKYGRPSASPVIEMTLPSVLDDTLAPVGQHVASLFIQYAPYELAEGHWDDLKEPFADRVFAIIDEYAPNFSKSVIGRDVVSPLDLEREFGLTGGNIFHGAMPLHQMFFFRPTPGYANYRTPLRGLYLCGAGAHPGGGVMGAPGANAAREVLRDVKAGRV